jgi:para-nitrobenzyl esterase
MAGSLDGSTGNWGIADQRLAMKWVVDHIGAFGGDGDRLTIMGESAGGNSILQHLTQSASFPYYRHAIVESGVYGGSKSGAYAESQYAGFVQRTSCANVTGATTCLRNLSTVEVETAAAAEMGAAANNGWGPVVDGVQNEDHELLQIENGRFNKVARVLMGSNRDEAAAGQTRINPQMTRVELEAALAHSGLKPAVVQDVIQLYEPAPRGRYGYPKGYPGMWSHWWWINMRAHTDLPFGGMPGHCATRKAARLLVKGGAPAVFLFNFQHATQASGISGGGSSGSGYVGNLLVPHAAELNYVHSSIPQSDATEHLLAVQTTSYWTQFATAGDPTHAGLPRWPALQNATDESVLLLDIEANEYGSPLRAASSLRSEACDFWERQFPSYYPTSPISTLAASTSSQHRRSTSKSLSNSGEKNGMATFT